MERFSHSCFVPDCRKKVLVLEEHLSCGTLCERINLRFQHLGRSIDWEISDESLGFYSAVSAGQATQWPG